jgi:hypothetical protein
MRNINQEYIQQYYSAQLLIDLMERQQIRKQNNQTNDYDSLYAQYEKINQWIHDVDLWAEQNNHILPSYEEICIANGWKV